MIPKRPRPRAALPAALTPLLGRTRELEETAALLGRTRLLTLTGAGGSGKTRLALELAQRVRTRFDDAFWVDLAPLSSAEWIAQQILAAMGVREVATDDATQVLIDTVRDRTLLFVLDNCEHLIGGVAAVVEQTLHSCQSISILTTSREPLGVAGEQTWLVPPLAEEDAVELFGARAAAVVPSFVVDDANREKVAQICRRLDCVPLAIELAAARVRAMSVAAIADHLDDAFGLLASGSRTVPRHRTIHDAIDWSYRLLSSEEQTLLRRLAVFAGGFSLDDAIAICSGGDLPVLAGLSALVDKSLVVFSGPRYRLFETVRQFAAEKLESAGEREPVREAHARHFTSRAEEAEPNLFGGAVDPPTLARIDAEIGNVRAAFDWAGEHQQRLEIALRLLHALHWYWFARGQFREAEKRSAASLESLRSAQQTIDRTIVARAAIAAATIDTWLARWSAIHAPIDEALAGLAGSNDVRSRGVALMLKGVACELADGDLDAARSAFDESQRLLRSALRDASERSVSGALALSLYWSAVVAQRHGDFAAARAALDETLRIGETIGSEPAIGHALALAGHLALQQRLRSDAIASFRRALEVHAAIDDRWGLTQVVEGIGLLLLESGEAETGTRLLAAASAAWIHLGARPARHENYEKETRERIRQALGDDRLRVVLASGAAMPYETMLAVAREQIERLESSAPESLPAVALRVRSLGGIEIELHGERVEESARARELLLFLLTRPDGATKEQIGAALWPDIDPAKLRNNFHVTVHRLRKALRDAAWIAVEDDTWIIDRGRGVEFDAELFEESATAGLRASDAARLAKAVALYRGDFLESAGAGEWHEEIRDRLADLHARAVTKLARIAMSAGDLETAIASWQKLAAIDDLDEEACRNLMTAYARQGDIAAATRAYRRLTDALRRELDTPPDPVTSQLHARLIAEA